MKRLLILIFILFVILIFFLSRSLGQNKIISYFVQKPNPSSPSVSQKSITLFVPYWTLGDTSIPSSYDTVVYFGLNTNMSGIVTTDTGYTDIPKFVQSIKPNRKTLLTVELLDQNTDEKILHNASFQKKVIDDSIAIAKKYNFSGIVLDLEYKALAFDEVINGITKLSTNFSLRSHKNNLKFYQVIFGDSFYQLRPFDIEAIGNVCDGIFVMAYDFHKANGNPGPNFPLNELPDEQYSFAQMVNDFKSKVIVDKLTIIFGMFGYDWPVDEKGQSIGQAQSFTTNQILEKFIDNCEKCNIIQNKALETEVNYKDNNGQNHIVWFEDLTSVSDKVALLNSKGINSIGYWAWGYF